MTFKLGLTGSIGMGKSTTARFFAEQGCDVWDADAAVHRLYDKGGAAVEPFVQALPDAVENGAVSRARLRNIVGKDPSTLKLIESIVHPLVAQDRSAFIQNSGKDIIVFDIPLLFETGGDKAMDAVACVSVSAEEQRRRVLARGTMDIAQFEAILAKQMPNAEKCARSDYVIETLTMDSAKAQVEQIVVEIRSNLHA